MKGSLTFTGSFPERQQPRRREHDQEARTRAGDRVRKGQFLDNEWRAYEEGMKNANTETDVDAVGNRILNNLRRAEEELEYVAKTPAKNRRNGRIRPPWWGA